MQLLWTKEEHILQQSAKKFFQQEWARKSDAAFWQKVNMAGWATLVLAEAAGGADATLLQQGIVLEQAGYVLCTPLLLTTAQAAVLCRDLYVNKSVQSLLVEQAATVVCDELAVVANPLQNGWTLTGVQRFVPVAREANMLLVWAKHGEGFALFEVNKENVTLHTQQAAADVMCVTFNCTPAICLAQHVTAAQFDMLYMKLAALQVAEMVGGMASVIDQTVRYVSERQQFGVAIGRF